MINFEGIEQIRNVCVLRDEIYTKKERFIGPAPAPVYINANIVNDALTYALAYERGLPSQANGAGLSCVTQIHESAKLRMGGSFP